MPDTLQYKTFSGNKNLYRVVGKKGHNILGVHLEHAVHPNSGDTYLVARFAGFNATDSTVFYTKHLTKRDEAEFLYGPETVSGWRLNRILIPLFNQNLSKSGVLNFGDHFKVWGKIGDWIYEAVLLEGYEAVLDVLFDQFVRDQFTPQTPGVESKLLLVLPNLSAPAEDPTPEDEVEENEEGDEEAAL